MSDNERLSRELRNRANQAGGHPISFDDVKRSATKMKWQQRAAAGAVAAVVLAIGVPVGMSVAIGDGTPKEGSGLIATRTPAPTDTLTTRPDIVGEVTLTLDAPAGDAPHVSWLDGTTLHTSGGTTVPLPKAYDDVASYRGGFVGADIGTYTIDVIRGGEVEDSFPGSGFAVSEDGTLVSWFEQNPGGPGQIKIGIASGMGEGEQSVEVAPGLDATPIVFRGTDVVYQTDDRTTGERKVWYTHRGRSFEIEGALAVGGYSSITDKVAVMTELEDFGSCWTLYGFPRDDDTGGFSDGTCDYSLGAFSADGEHLIGWDAYGDGWGDGDVTILDARTLEPVMHFAPPRDHGLQDDALWEDDSLIARAYLDGTWQLLRLGVDGSIETASRAVGADDTSSPFLLVSLR